MGGRGSGRGQGAEVGRGRGWALLTNVRGGLRAHAAESAPQSLAPRSALGPSKLGGLRLAAHSLEGQAPWASLSLSTPLGPRTPWSLPPLGPLRAFAKAGERRPRYLTPKHQIP